MKAILRDVGIEYCWERIVEVVVKSCDVLCGSESQVPQKHTFFKNCFLCGPFFKKSLLTSVTILLLFYVLVFWPWGMWDLSSQTRDWTCTLCIRRWSLNHWTTREIPGTHYLIAFLCLFSSAFSAGIIGLEPTVCRAQYWIPWEVGVRKKKDTALLWVAFVVQWQYSKALSKAEMWMRAGGWDCQSAFRDGHVKERKSVWGGGPGSQVDLPHSDSSCFSGLGTPTESPCKE